MRAHRLLSILLLLQTRGRLSAQVLADQFEVSVRTIYRDVDELSAAGIPIYGDSGPGGGFALLDGYRTGLTGLTVDETQALFLSGFPQAADLAGLSEVATIAKLKLQAAMTTRNPTDRLADRLHLDPTAWYRRPSQPRHLDVVARATLEGRQLQICYESWTKSVKSTVDPLGLVLKAGVWYLVAGANGHPRTYRVSGISEATATQEPVRQPAGFVLADFWNANRDAFERGLNRLSATIRVAPAGMRRLDVLGSAIEDAVRAAQPDSKGWRTAEVPIESIDNAAELFLWFGSSFEVVAPPELRQRINELALGIARVHGSGDFTETP
jgi:predicted DNA-binding transcriptional regulator YafY